jgi:hypothetical protein
MTRIKRMEADFFFVIEKQIQIFHKTQNFANLAIFPLRALRLKNNNLMEHG